MEVVQIASTTAHSARQINDVVPDPREVARALVRSLSPQERVNLAREMLGQTQSPVVEESKLSQGFLADSRNRGLAENSLVSYRSVLRRFGNYQHKQDRHIAQIDSAVLEGFLADLRALGLKSNTLTNYFAVLSSLCEYLVFRGLMDTNPVPAFEKRYLRRYKKMKTAATRKLVSIEEMAMLINSTMDARDKAIITLLAKTGIRRDETVNIDLNDMDWERQSIMLKEHPKRSNRTVFFDDETARVLKAWLRIRPSRARKDSPALFVGETGNRLKRSGVYNMVTKQAEKMGLHNPESGRTEDHFTPHCCRHWFTTMLARSGIDKDLLKELRGDARRESMDVYRHIDPEELRRAYLAHIPELGI